MYTLPDGRRIILEEPASPAPSPTRAPRRVTAADVRRLQAEVAAARRAAREATACARRWAAEREVEAAISAGVIPAGERQLALDRFARSPDEGRRFLAVARERLVERELEAIFPGYEARS